MVAALATVPDPEVRAGVEAFVDASLRHMPEHLRAGVVAGSVTLAAGSLGARLLGRPLAAYAEALERSPLPPVRQYVRLLRSLVLFAEQELLADRVA